MSVKAHLLILDDDPNLRTVLSDILTTRDYHIHRASTGRDALKILESESIQVALIDLNLEDMKGTEVIRQIQIRSPETKSILLTGHASKEAAIEALNQGAYYFFQKPVNPEQLLLIVRNAVEVQRSEQRLRQSERKNRSVVSALPDCIMEINNKGELEYLQQPPEKDRFLPEISVGQHLDDFLPGYLSQQIQENVIQTLETDSLREFTFRLQGNGQTRHFEIRIAPAGESTVLALVRDQTDQKNFQKQAEERRVYLELLFRAAPDAIITLDHRHRVTEWNRAAEEIFGYQEADVIGKNLDRLILPEKSHFKEEAEELTRQVLEGQIVSPLETIRFRKDGSPVHVIVAGAPIHIDGKLVGVVSTYTDITDRVEMEFALQESESRYRTFMDNFDGIVYRSGVGFDFEFIHGAVTEITGYTEQDFLSGEQRWFDLIHPEDREKIIDAQSIQQSPELSLDREYRLRKKGGDVIWVSEMLQSFRDLTGEEVYLQGVIRDISDQKSLQNILDWQLRVNRDVAELSHKIIESAPIGEVSELVMKKAQQLTGSTFGFVGYLNPETRDLISLAISDEIWEYYPMGSHDLVQEDFLDLWDEVVGSKQPVLANQEELKERSPEALPDDLQIHNLLSAPVLLDDQVVGFISLLNSGTDYISRDLQLVMYLADIYALALGRKETEQQLRYMATHDELTDLPNRVYFNASIREALAKTRGKDLRLALMLLDLNNFKQVNDTFGHDTGDQVLQETAQRLQSSLRTSDTIARWGGDEFVIVVESDTDYSGVEVVVEKVLQVFDEPITLNESEIQMDVSVGISLFPTDGQDVETLLRHADEAMYHAKANHQSHSYYCESPDLAKTHE